MKRLSLTSWIFIGMALGVVVGVVWPHGAAQLGPIANVFLRLIRVIVALLVFATLVAGIAGSGDLKRMGRIGAKAILFFEVVTTLALFLGLASVNLAKPGLGVPIQASAAAQAAPASAPASAATILEHIFPTSIADAMARNDVLQVVVFAFLFGISCAAVGAKSEPIVTLCNSLAEVMFQFTKYVMYLAPFGVGAALAVTVGSKGIAVLFGLSKLIVTMYISAAIVILAILLPCVFIFRIPLGRFYQAAREPFLIAFSTASSEAALPSAMENMEQFGVPKHIVGFVIPTGYSFNLVGSTLYLSMASIFIAQAAGMHMAWSEQLLMMLTLMLTSKGVAGVPRAAIVILSATVANFNLPMEGVAVLLGVDAVLDMARTAINVLGNCLAAAAVARWEGYNLEPAAAAAGEESNTSAARVSRVH